ncbi:MAG: class I SAM-dependent methyltransferase [Chloroflexi bacterium]|nr:class I SAM-dependent methyltransferase [Chloroflexota bacterium]
MKYDFKVGFWRKRALKAAIDRREDRESWAGVRITKLPSDCFAMQKLLCRGRPQVLVELGSQFGGSALFFASFAALAGLEAIVSVDIEDLEKPKIPLATFITGDSSSPEVFAQVQKLVGGRTCSVVIDSNHHAEHVDKELALYAPLVSPGQALILEDTLVDVLNFKKFRAAGGPLASIKKYMPAHPEFELASDIEPYVSTNYFGYWVRKK